MSQNISTMPPVSCTLCPRRCGADRAAGQTGFCGAGGTLKAARAALHFWEEPCISGTRGSGTVFFSGCTLKCCFCQNYPISAEGLGKEITIAHLAEIFLGLQEQGAHNINLVTPGQWRPWIIAALDIARAGGLRLPIVCNTGGYETVESVEAWRGYIDIWLADLKYVSSSLSAELSSAPDYFAQARPAIEAMMAQAGHPVFDSEGILQKGVILRHLALPGHIDDSFAVLDQMAAWNEADPGCFIPSVMSQYTPFYKAAEHGIGRRITTYEYRRVVNYAMDLGLTAGYMQQKSSAREEYTPSFDLTGIKPVGKPIRGRWRGVFQANVQRSGAPARSVGAKPWVSGPICGETTGWPADTLSVTIHKNPTKFSLAVFFFSLQILSESTIMDTTMCVMWGLAALLSTKRPVSRRVYERRRLKCPRRATGGPLWNISTPFWATRRPDRNSSPAVRSCCA